MNNRTLTAWSLRFAFTFAAGLLTLALFDDTPWPGVLGWSAAASAASSALGRLFHPGLDGSAAAFADGLVGAVLAWLSGILFAGFRATGATVIALGILLALGRYFASLFFQDSRTAAR